MSDTRLGRDPGSGVRGPRRSEPAGSASLRSPTPGHGSRLLSVERLTTGFDIKGRFIPAVIDVSFHIGAGETLCLVGESGSGKSLTALSIMRLVQSPGRIERGRLVFKGRDLRELREREMQKIRGAEIALIFQEPMTALNPVFTIGNQIEETLRVHGRAGRRDAHQKAIELLDAVSVPEPQLRVRDYPHQLSGGLRARTRRGRASPRPRSGGLRTGAPMRPRWAGGPCMATPAGPAAAPAATNRDNILDWRGAGQKGGGLALLAERATG